MAVFPTTPKYSSPVQFIPKWKTLKSSFESGSEQRRQKWLYAKYDVKVVYKALELSDAQTIYEFYMARKGSYEAFYFYDTHVMNNINMYVATCDGVTTTFDIPGKSTSSRTLYESGSEVTSGFSYLTGGGDGDSDRVDYTTAPASGTILTIDFTGYIRSKVRFKEDYISRENFIMALFKYGLELKGL